MSLKILRKFIQEEIGRNQQTVDPGPYTYADLPDYNIEINGSDEHGFFLTVEYQGEKLVPVNTYRTYEDARHASRMVVDHDRVKRMNH